MQRAEEFSTSDGYEVVFAHRNDGPFVTVVKLNGSFVARADGFTSHTRAARWARRKIRQHRRAASILRST